MQSVQRSDINLDFKRASSAAKWLQRHCVDAKSLDLTWYTDRLPRHAAGKVEGLTALTKLYLNVKNKPGHPEDKLGTGRWPVFKVRLRYKVQAMLKDCALLSRRHLGCGSPAQVVVEGMLSRCSMLHSLEVVCFVVPVLPPLQLLKHLILDDCFFFD